MKLVFEIKYDIGWLRSPHSKVDSAEMKLLRFLEACSYSIVGEMIN
jgi:hypothetical protein